ncbi:MAG: DUF169 domain-containing protein [Proteobacteria bacterium]|nr:DUF169 domain-containing protein [Pseudomonadota bacterium]
MEKTLEEYREAAREVYDRLRLPSAPVAVRFITDDDEIPAGFLQPSAMGQKWSLCQAFTFARKNKGNVAMTARDNFCLASTLAQGWVKLPLDDLIESQILNKWRLDLTAELRVQGLFIEVASPEIQAIIQTHRGFLAAPATRAPFVPHSVLFYGNPGQITHAIQALSYDGKNLCRSAFNGYAESCIKGALLPHVTGKPQVVIPGAGDRAFSNTGDDEMALGVPGPVLFSLRQNLFKSGLEFNLGYPVAAPLVGHLTEDILPGWTYIKKRLEEEGRPLGG